MKDPVKKMKRQATDWEKIFANYIFGLVLRIGIKSVIFQNSKIKNETIQSENKQKT